MQIRKTREAELLNFGARSGEDYLLKTQILPLQTQARGSAPTLLSAFDLCGNFVAATEVNPPMLHQC